jgi:membrane-associated protease RseP (regulator of RpoE activity)
MLKNNLMISLLLILMLCINFAIAQNNPAFNTQPTGSQLEKQTPWLGVWIENVPIALGKHLSSILQENQGVLVSRIHDNSPAQKAGLKEYDVIAQLNDQKIFSSQQLSQLIYNAKVDSKMTMHYVNQGKMLTKEVVLTAKPQQGFSQRITPNKVQPLSPPLVPHRFNQLMQPGLNFQDFSNRFQSNAKRSSWSEFESLLIQSTEPNKYKVSVTYQDSNSNKKEFTFEGDMQQIQQQIRSTKDMDENKKMNLLAALVNQGNSNSRFQHGFFPDNWFNQYQQGFPPHVR